MSEAPKLRAYMVATQWDSNVGSVGLFVEYTSEMAAAVAVLASARSAPPTSNLTNLTVSEVDVASLRQIVVAVESGKPTGQVVQLVPSTPPEGRGIDPWPGYRDASVPLPEVPLPAPQNEPEPPAA